jgi:hypothetical protein
MLFSIIKWSIISLTLIFLVHHLYTFLMNTLTVPKIKDLVNKPKEQYKDLFQTMQQNSKKPGANGIGANGIGANGIGANGIGANGIGANGIGANAISTDMTEELSSFLNDLKKNGENSANSLGMGANGLGMGANTIGANDNIGLGVNGFGANGLGASANDIGSNAFANVNGTISTANEFNSASGFSAF